MPLSDLEPTNRKVMRNSERITYRTCRMLHHLSYVRQLTGQTSKALLFGTGIHFALERWYPVGRQRGIDPRITFEEWYRENDSFSQYDDDGSQIDALELGLSMLEGYLDEYGTDDHLEVIEPEMVFRHDVLSDSGRYLRTWTGTQDLCVLDLSRSNKRRKRVFFFEHKTSKNVLPTHVEIMSQYGEQALSYWCGGTINLRRLGIIDPDVCVDGVMFNWLKKALPDDRPKNAQGYAVNKPTKENLAQWLLSNGALTSDDEPEKMSLAKLTNLVDSLTDGKSQELCGEPSKRQPSPRFSRFELDFGDRELDVVINRVTADAWEIDQASRGRLPLSPTPQDRCSWCEFKQVCELRALGEDWKFFLESEFFHNNPNDEYALESSEND